MTTGKRQPPLWLDMSFEEALGRFAGTDPKEAEENERAEAAKKRLSEGLVAEVPKKVGRPTRKRNRPQ